MTNLIVHRWAVFGWAERPQVWFWRAFEHPVANDNNQQGRLFA